MNRLLNLTLMCCLCSLLFSCGELTGEDTGANILDGKQEVVGGLNAVSVGGQKFLLTGTVDNGGNAGHSFRLRFKLPEGKLLKFHFYVSRSFSGGATFSFKRSEGAVNLTMSLNGKTDTIELEDFSDSEVIDIDLDIHNDHSDAHLLVWDRNGAHGDSDECTFDGDCLYNSEDFAFDKWLGVGKASGVFWGVEGDKSLILLLEGPLPAISDA
ncbi:MAG: hypothetical protein ACPGJV_04705 [Bacteriovoracaceae bacterium]